MAGRSTCCDRGSAKVVGRAAGATRRFRIGLATDASRRTVRDTKNVPTALGTKVGARDGSRTFTARAGSIARPLAPFLGARANKDRTRGCLNKLRLEKIRGLCLQQLSSISNIPWLRLEMQWRVALRLRSGRASGEEGGREAGRQGSRNRRSSTEDRLFLLRLENVFSFCVSELRPISNRGGVAVRFWKLEAGSLTLE